MTFRKTNWIDYCRLLCCLWIVALWHMERYLISPRGIENEAGEYITSGVLATFFFVSGFLACGGGIGRKVRKTRIIRRAF